MSYPVHLVQGGLLIFLQLAKSLSSCSIHASHDCYISSHRTTVFLMHEASICVCGVLALKLAQCLQVPCNDLHVVLPILLCGLRWLQQSWSENFVTSTSTEESGTFHTIYKRKQVGDMFLTGRETGANDSSCAPQRIPAPHRGPKKGNLRSGRCVCKQRVCWDLFRVAYSRVCHTTADNICFLFRISAASPHIHTLNRGIISIYTLFDLAVKPTSWAMRSH